MSAGLWTWPKLSGCIVNTLRQSSKSCASAKSRSSRYMYHSVVEMLECPSRRLPYSIPFCRQTFVPHRSKPARRGGSVRAASRLASLWLRGPSGQPTNLPPSRSRCGGRFRATFARCGAGLRGREAVCQLHQICTACRSTISFSRRFMGCCTPPGGIPDSAAVSHRIASARNPSFSVENEGLSRSGACSSSGTSHGLDQSRFACGAGKNIIYRTPAWKNAPAERLLG